MRMNLTELKSLLRQFNITPQKRLGQNFLIDNNLRNKIINLSDISNTDVVLEVGAGFGVLTDEILKKAKKVYAVEIDKVIYSYLDEYLSVYDNLELIKGDILEIDIPNHNKFISNIPYSITGPILESIFFKSTPPEGILTIEKKLADRIFFQGDYSNFSRITVSVNSFMEPVKQVQISSKSFYPAPKIELSLIKLNPKENLDDFLKDTITRKFYLEFVAGIMPYKNKNIVNAIELHCKNNSGINLNKEEISQILEDSNYENNKPINFSIEEFIEITKKIYTLNENK